MAVVGTPIPSTIQQSIVRTRAIISLSPAIEIIALISSFARPVIVIQPEMMPATPQAAATVIVPFPPATRASSNLAGVIRFFLSKRLTKIARRFSRMTS